MSCIKHPTKCVWRELDHMGGVAYGKTVSRFCITCCDYVPWGPAADTDETAVELRAAVLAMFPADQTIAEWAGERCFYEDYDPPAGAWSAGAWAGWLSAVIAEHKEEAP